MESSFWKKYEKHIFYMAVVGAFLAIALFNFLTPIMSDDYSYSVTARALQSVGDLFKSEYEQYMTWTGRSVNHLILKAFLHTDTWVFRLCNSINFVLLTLLFYYNIEGKKRYDAKIYLLINLVLWIFTVEFEETVLWETGACNYLWGTTNILVFVTLFKYACSKRETLKHPAGWSVLLFFFGVIAGWCNENTSGGGLLLVLIAMAGIWQKEKKIRVWMWTGAAGMVTGLLFMVLAPGNRNRAQYAEDNYGGLVKYIARGYKVTLAIEENFFILLLIFLVLLLLAKAQKRTWKELSGSLIYFFVFTATCYALILAPTPMNRAYFGAGVFLMLALVQCFVKVGEEEVTVKALKNAFVYGMALFMAFTYLDNAVDTARIYRDYTNRDRYIWEQKEAGETDITVPLLHEGFESDYSFGYASDFGEDAGYWINQLACTYYGVNSIAGVPMEEWNGYEEN